MKAIYTFFAIIGVTILSVGFAQAWHTEGCVYCDVNEDGVINDGDTPLEGVEINVSNFGETFSQSGTTGTDGCYKFSLPDIGDSYNESLNETTLPEGSTITPFPPIMYTLDSQNISNEQDWLIDSYTCRPQQCWLTAGGVKFNSLIGDMVDEFSPNGPVHSWGGNVNPACAPVKGHWNHIAHKDKLHFQATDIEVLQCGNVPGIEPGSESPVTPVNFIEFTGPATLKGIKGNKFESNEVCYFARAEDRNEPGSNGAKDGDEVDRYFLHVYDCGSGETLLLVSMDADPANVAPVTITGGNMQMHWQPCDN